MKIYKDLYNAAKFFVLESSYYVIRENGGPNSIIDENTNETLLEFIKKNEEKEIKKCLKNDFFKIIRLYYIYKFKTLTKEGKEELDMIFSGNPLHKY